MKERTKKTKEEKRFPKFVFAAILFAFMLLIGLPSHIHEIEADTASTTAKCPHCGGTKFTTNYVIEQPTCQKGGRVGTVCSNCKWERVVTDTPRNTHQYNVLVSDSATCKAVGKRIYKCQWCTLTKEEASPKKAHTWGATIHQEPTCITAGGDYSKCTVCGATSSGTVIPATGGHSYTVFVRTDVVATCKNKGSDVYRCSTPGCTAEIKKETPITGNHTWNQPEATCTAAKRCVYCDHVAEAIKPHTNKEVVTKASTCYSGGHVALYCTVCDSNTGGYDTPPSYNHQYTIFVKTEKAATCKNKGVAIYRCSTPGCTAEIEKETPLLSHVFQTVIESPTCGKEGCEYVKCTMCGTNTGSGKVLPPTGNHTWELTGTTSATCTANGYKLYTCSVCKQTKKESIAKLGHSYRQVTTKQPTCGTAGTYETKCSRCGIGSPTGNGTIPPTGKHTWGLTSTTQPTCTANGYRLYTCSVCKQIKKESITKLGHAYSQVTTKQPTCGAEGTYETKCSRCGIGSPTGNGTIAPTGKHTWELTSTTSSTCTANGYNLYTCSVCKQTKKETIPMSEHTMKVAKKAATVKAEGYEKKYCTKCGYVEYNKVIPKLTITATYDTAGGTFPNGGKTSSKSVSYGGVYGKVDTPSRSGYTFKGWYTGKTGGKAVSETTKVSATSNHTVYAHWLKNTAISANASDDSFSFVIDDFGGEGWSYYFVETSGETSKITQPSWITSLKCTTSTRTISFKCQSTSEEPKDAYLYTYSKTSGKAITYKIKAPEYYLTVTLDVRGVNTKYYVPWGQTFTFPEAPELQDGELFNGWKSEDSDTIYQSGDTIIISSSRKVSALFYVSYKIIGTAYNPEDHKLYNVWMVEDDGVKKEFLANCTQKHHDNDLIILDYYDQNHGRTYQIRDSWQYTDDLFKIDVCKLIIQYNKDKGRTSEWKRTLEGCFLEWSEHNTWYEIFSVAPGKLSQELAEQARHVDLDATASGNLPPLK